MPNKGVLRPHWTEQEDEVLKEFYPDIDKCIEKLASIGSTRNRDAVVRRATKTLLHTTAPNTPWTEREDEILSNHYPDEGPESVVKLLEEIGSHRTASAVCSRASAMGVRRSDNMADGRWTDAEVEIVKQTYPSGGVVATERELEAHGYHRTRSAINARAQIVGARRELVRRTEKVGDIKVINFVVDTVLDKDIIEHLDGQRNRSNYIRSVIKKDIERG